METFGLLVSSVSQSPKTQHPTFFMMQLISVGTFVVLRRHGGRSTPEAGRPGPANSSLPIRSQSGSGERLKFKHAQGLRGDWSHTSAQPLQSKVCLCGG